MEWEHEYQQRSMEHIQEAAEHLERNGEQLPWLPSISTATISGSPGEGFRRPLHEARQGLMSCWHLSMGVFQHIASLDRLELGGGQST